MEHHPSAAEDFPEELQKRTLFLLQSALTRAQTMGEAALVECGISGQEYGVLAMLQGRPALSQRQISAVLGVDRTTITAVLARLERRGFVARAPQPDNRRANSVQLTGAGEDLRAGAALLLAECEEDFLAPLTNRDRATLHRHLLVLVGPSSERPEIDSHGSEEGPPRRTATT